MIRLILCFSLSLASMSEKVGFFDISQDIISIDHVRDYPIRYVIYKINPDDNYVLFLIGPNNQNVKLIEKKKVVIFWVDDNVGNAENVPSVYKVYSSIDYKRVVNTPEISDRILQMPHELNLEINVDNSTMTSKQFWYNMVISHKIKSGYYGFYHNDLDGLHYTRGVIDIGKLPALGEYSLHLYILDSKNDKLKWRVVKTFTVEDNSVLRYVYSIYDMSQILYVVIAIVVCVVFSASLTIGMEFIVNRWFKGGNKDYEN